MTSAQQNALLTGSGCPVALDNVTRQLYATDASMYRVEPAAVGFPRNTKEASNLVMAAAQAGLSVIPRGAGTGLAGGAIGEGVVIDFSRHNRWISDLDLERQTVRVGAGLVLDQLNAFLRPHGFMFGPDVATSSRATIGGMIASNSSGSHVPVYGTTRDHVMELQVVLADGSVVMVGAGHDTLRKQRELVQDLLYFHGLTIAERLPAGLLKRNPGYDLLLKERRGGGRTSPDQRVVWTLADEVHDLNPILCGSEGTLAAITEAEVRIVPTPVHRTLGIIFFETIEQAMEATLPLGALEPAAIEHMDRVLLDQTRGQLEFAAARSLLGLDRERFECLLAVEFFGDDAEDRLNEMVRMDLGRRTLALQTAAQAALVWNLRKAGLSLLTGRKGPAKPVTCIEDTAVRPEVLLWYVNDLRALLGRLDLEASFYGHAASGLLHLRPVLDLRDAEGRRKFRELADEVSVLVRQYGGSLAGEHGVGIARTEYMEEQVGEALLGVMHEIKNSFDPHNLFNPGKIIPDGRYRIDGDLRADEVYHWPARIKLQLAFAAKDDSFFANLDQCNGCGGCRKEAPTMCPTFQATGEEVLSTRGRANVIRSVLAQRGFGNGDPLRVGALAEVLESCLGCKACTVECPSNVNMVLLKAELQGARNRHYGLGWREYLTSRIDVLGRLGCLWPSAANVVVDSLIMRTVFHKVLGLAWQRRLPHYTRQRFDRWFEQRGKRGSGARGRVILWDDTFVRYHEPEIGKAAVRVLEAAGYKVSLAKGRACCGRPSFSQGDLQRAAKLGMHNLLLLRQMEPDLPIIFLEPSCWSMFKEDYEELRLPGARAVAERCFLFEEFLENLLMKEPDALHFGTQPSRVLVHAHCHAKALLRPQFMARLARRLPGRNVTLLDTGCCGMAGAFGMTGSKYELSLKVAEPLSKHLRGQPLGTVVVASGTSCRHQIDHLAPLNAKHMAELLAEALSRGR